KEPAVRAPRPGLAITQCTQIHVVRRPIWTEGDRIVPLIMLLRVWRRRAGPGPPAVPRRVGVIARRLSLLPAALVRDGDDVIHIRGIDGDRDLGRIIGVGARNAPDAMGHLSSGIAWVVSRRGRAGEPGSEEYERGQAARQASNHDIASGRS